jgi:hypothetical protein
VAPSPGCVNAVAPAVWVHFTAHLLAVWAVGFWPARQWILTLRCGVEKLVPISYTYRASLEVGTLPTVWLATLPPCVTRADVLLLSLAANALYLTRSKKVLALGPRLQGTLLNFQQAPAQPSRA